MFKVIKKDTERRQRHYSLIFIFNFQQISHLTVVLTYLTWTSRITTGWSIHKIQYVKYHERAVFVYSLMTVKRNTFDIIATYEKHLFSIWVFFQTQVIQWAPGEGDGGTSLFTFTNFSILANIQIFLYSLASDLAYVTRLFDEIYSRLTSGN